MYTYNNTNYQYRGNGTGATYGCQDCGRRGKKHNKRKLNLPALGGSVVGTLAPMLFLKHRQKTKLHKINYKFKQIMLVGAGAISGGLAGGLLGDSLGGRKNNVEKKVKEANFQFITNLLIPTFLVDRFLKLAEKKVPESAGKFKHKAAKAAAVIAGVGGGMKIGEFLTNKLHGCVGKQRGKERKLQAKDALIHLDDLPIALTLSEVSHVDKLLPFCFAYSGYQAGSKD